MCACMTVRSRTRALRYAAGTPSAAVSTRVMAHIYAAHYMRDKEVVGGGDSCYETAQLELTLAETWRRLDVLKRGRSV
jgi:hypothetical protein